MLFAWFSFNESFCRVKEQANDAAWIAQSFVNGVAQPIFRAINLERCHCSFLPFSNPLSEPWRKLLHNLRLCDKISRGVVGVSSPAPSSSYGPSKWPDCDYSGLIPEARSRILFLIGTAWTFSIVFSVSRRLSIGANYRNLSDWSPFHWKVQLRTLARLFWMWHTSPVGVTSRLFLNPSSWTFIYSTNSM